MSTQLALDLTERQELARCEATIERGLTTFVEVGGALLEIRDDRLYRESHGTFEDYCHERWGFTDRRARQLMGAAEIGTIVPVPNEGVARELAPLRDQPDLMREVWSEVVAEHPQPTAAQVREHVEPPCPSGFSRISAASSSRTRRTDANAKTARTPPGES